MCSHSVVSQNVHGSGASHRMSIRWPHSVEKTRVTVPSRSTFAMSPAQ